jgi:type IV pilus assembly protein PilE
MKMRTQRAASTAGFTLVELMVSIVVATILITIAVPSYTNQIRKSRRTDARAAVLDLAQREERYMSTNSTYTTSPANLGYSGPNFPVTLGDNYYTLTVAVVPATPTAPATYTITANAIGAQLKDQQCQTLSVTSAGVQSSTPGTTCWTN